MAGSSLGATPLVNQYSGRYSCSANSGSSYTEYAEPGMIGKIQVGAELGGPATVIVPACSAPVAASGPEPVPAPGPGAERAGHRHLAASARAPAAAVAAARASGEPHREQCCHAG